MRHLCDLQYSAEGPLVCYRMLPSLDEVHFKKIFKSSKQNTELLGGYITAGVAANEVRNVDVEIAQHLLSGAVEAIPELSVSMPQFADYDASADYLQVFTNALAAS